MSRFGLAVKRLGGKQKDLGSIALRLSILFKKVAVCGHCPVTSSLTINDIYIGSHRCPCHSGGDSVALGI